MELTAYTIVDDTDLNIQPAEQRRDWMDETPKSFAYRCLPLSMANMHGWELTVPNSFEVVWNGDPEPEGIQVIPDGEDEKQKMFSMGSVDVLGRFGHGIVTFYTRAIFRTPEGYNLWVTGRPNMFKDGIQPLSALVETDWMPYTFTMNWKITRPNHRVRFEEGDPYCFFFPVPRGDIEQMKPKIRQLEKDSEMEQQLRVGKMKREFTSKVRELKDVEDEDIDNLHEIKPQGWYMKGEYPDGSEGFSDHQRTLDIKPFSSVEQSSSDMGDE